MKRVITATLIPIAIHVPIAYIWYLSGEPFTRGAGTAYIGFSALVISIVACCAYLDLTKEGTNK
jgi:hypothetical protein